MSVYIHTLPSGCKSMDRNLYDCLQFAPRMVPIWRYELSSLAQEFDELQQEKSQLEGQLKSYRRSWNEEVTSTHATDGLSLGSKIGSIKQFQRHIINTKWYHYLSIYLSIFLSILSYPILSYPIHSIYLSICLSLYLSYLSYLSYNLI